MSERKKLTLSKPLSFEKEAALSQQKEAVEHQQKLEQQRQEQQLKMKKLKDTLSWLYLTFPKAFDKKRSKALKTKIEQDIFPLIPEESGITKTVLRGALSCHTGCLHYQKSVLKNEKRVDLNGIEVETITKQHRQYARDRMKYLKENSIKKRRKSVR